MLKLFFIEIGKTEFSFLINGSDISSKYQRIHFNEFYDKIFVFSPVWQLALYISLTFFPFSPPSLPYPMSLPSLTVRVTFHPYGQSYPPPHENVTAAILSYAVSHLHEGTGKLRKTCADTVGHLTEPVRSLTVSVKWPPAQCFDVQAADRRSPIQVLTQRKAVSFGWSPGIRHLPNTEHCRFNWLTED